MTALFATIVLTLVLIVACLIPWTRSKEPSIVETFESLREQLNSRNAHLGLSDAVNNASRAFAELDVEDVRRERSSMFDLVPRDVVGVFSRSDNIGTANDVTSF